MEVGELFKTTRSARQMSMAQVAEAAGVSASTILEVERSGVYTGMRVLDFLKLVQFYGLDLTTIASLLGYGSETQIPNKLQPLFQAAGALDEEEQEWLVGVLDALLRGVRRK